MGQDRDWQPVLDYLRERANRPFGDVEARSGRLLQSFSFAGQQAAENLLVKARRALDHQDPDRGPEHWSSGRCGCPSTSTKQ